MIAARGREPSQHAHRQYRAPARTGRLQRRIALVVEDLGLLEIPQLEQDLSYHGEVHRLAHMVAVPVVDHACVLKQRPSRLEVSPKTNDIRKLVKTDGGELVITKLLPDRKTPLE